MGYPKSKALTSARQLSEVGAEEGGDFGDGREGVGEEGGEDREDVGVARVNVEGGGDAGGAGALIEAMSVVEEGFFGADLDEKRRKIVKVSVER
jgi:hypothetical protein